jgi:hypothetical protein
MYFKQGFPLAKSHTTTLFYMHMVMGLSQPRQDSHSVLNGLPALSRLEFMGVARSMGRKMGRSIVVA